MMKQLKKLTIVSTAAFLFCLTVASGTLHPLPTPSVTIETEEDVKPTPLPQEPGIEPLSDGDEVSGSSKTK